MKKLILIAMLFMSMNVFSEIEWVNNNTTFNVYSDNGGMRMMVFDKNLLGFGTLVKPERNSNGELVVMLINENDKDDYIVATLSFYDKYGDLYVYDVNKDPQLIALMKRATGVNVFIVNEEYGDEYKLFAQRISCKGFTHAYNQL